MDLSLQFIFIFLLSARSKAIAIPLTLDLLVSSSYASYIAALFAPPILLLLDMSMYIFLVSDTNCELLIRILKIEFEQ